MSYIKETSINQNLSKKIFFLLFERVKKIKTTKRIGQIFIKHIFNKRLGSRLRKDSYNSITRG